MFRPSALLIAGAVLATAGAAHAQSAGVAANQAVQAAQDRASTPWYQRFTTSNGATESMTGQAENDRQIQPSWTLSQRWGVTVDLREAQRTDTIEGGRGDQASVGAYYQFTPSVRVGGQVSLESTERPGAAVAPRQVEEPEAGVRVESAFRF